jgi:cytochrome c
MRKFSVLAVAAAATIAFAGPAFSEGDPAAGENVFKKCATCHALEEAKNKAKQGPILAGVIGRVPGTVPEFKYSKAMIDFGASGKVWDEATLTEYLADPKGVVKGTKMAFAGLKGDKGPQDIADVIAYIKTFSPAPAAQ